MKMYITISIVTFYVARTARQGPICVTGMHNDLYTRVKPNNVQYPRLNCFKVTYTNVGQFEYENHVHQAVNCPCTI